MKKYIGLTLFALLIIAFGATAYAVDLKASGYVRADSYWFKNTTSAGVNSPIYGPIGSDYQPPGSGTSYGGAFNKDAAYMKGRMRLKFDLITDKNLSGTVFFEIDSDRWGDKDGTRNSMGYWSADRAAVEVKNVYLDVGLPYFGIQLPISARVGLQGLSIRPNMAESVDGMGINGTIKIDPVTINPFWFKPYEGNDAAADDVDVYGLQLSAKIDKNTIGAYGFNYNMNSFPIPTTVATYGATPVFPYQADMWWIGAYADGKLGPTDFNFDFVYDTGKVEKTSGAAAGNVDYRGWVTRLKVDYPWEKFNFGFVGIYGSGSDQKKTDGTGLPGTNASPWGGTNTKVGSYVIPPGCETTSMTEGFVFYDNEWMGVENYNTAATGKTAGTSNVGYMSRGAWGGTWMAKLYASASVTPWYKIMIQGMYIGDTTKNGNTVGNARTAGVPRDDKDIGWELGLINTLNIYKNLTWYIGGGYLIAGDAMDLWNGTTNVSPQNPWQISTRLLYEF